MLGEHGCVTESDYFTPTGPCFLVFTQNGLAFPGWLCASVCAWYAWLH